MSDHDEFAAIEIQMAKLEGIRMIKMKKDREAASVVLGVIAP